MKLFDVVFEDEELLVVNKPADLVCHPTKTDEYSSLISRLRLYLGPDSHPQLVNRLDRETSGVTVVAKTLQAARELRRIWETRQVEKDYLALVHGRPKEQHGSIDAALGKDEQSKVAIKDCVRADGLPALTEWWTEVSESHAKCAKGVKEREIRSGSPLPTLRPLRETTLLRVRPHTGRKHQIRIHLGHIGHPIVGDKLYGGDEDLYLALVENRLTDEQRARLVLPNHALHAYQLRFQWRGQSFAFHAELRSWEVR